ncbi:hypothetical protein ACOME3_000244 [Neoechinorhynchus agilis]
MFTADDPTITNRIQFEEFTELWSTLKNWYSSFRTADTDKSGLVDMNECQNILRAYGYILSDDFISFMFSKFVKEDTRKLDFDAYCNLIAGLLVATNIFKKIDQTRKGVAVIDFPTFMLSVLSVTRKLKGLSSPSTGTAAGGASI